MVSSGFGTSYAPHSGSYRSTRGSGYGGEEECLYDSIPYRGSQPESPWERFTEGGSIHDSHGSFRRRASQGIGLEVTGELPHVVKRVVGLMDQFMVKQDQPGYSNPPIFPGDAVLNIDGMPAANVSVELLQDMLQGEAGSPVHITLARFESGELYTACVLRHTLYCSQPPSSGGPSTRDSQKSNPPLAYVNAQRSANKLTETPIEGLQAKRVQVRSEAQHITRNATPSALPLQHTGAAGHKSTDVYAAPPQMPIEPKLGIYYDSPRFGRVLKKSGTLWRKVIPAGTTRHATGNDWDQQSEKCECGLEDGRLRFFQNNLPSRHMDDEVIDLSKWTLDTQPNAPHLTLVEMATGRLIDLFADSEEERDDWRRALQQSMPGLGDSSSEIPEMYVPATLVNDFGHHLPITTQSQSAQRQVQIIQPSTHHALRSGIVSQAQPIEPVDRAEAHRESGLRVLTYGRTHGILRCYFAHWKVFGLKGSVGVVINEYMPEEEAQKREALRLDDQVAVVVSNGRGWSRGWHLPENRWMALSRYPRDFWFPTACVSVESDSSGYWGRVWPLTINVVGARHLLSSDKDKGKPDPYVTVQVGSSRKEIARRKRTINPLWVEQVGFEVVEDEMVSIVVWDWNGVKRDEAIGYVEISAGRLVQDCEAAWNDVANQSRSANDKDPFSHFPGTKGYKLFGEDGSEILGSGQDEAVLFLQAYPQEMPHNSFDAVGMQELSWHSNAAHTHSSVDQGGGTDEVSSQIKLQSSPASRPQRNVLAESRAGTDAHWGVGGTVRASEPGDTQVLDTEVEDFTVGVMFWPGKHDELLVTEFKGGTSALNSSLQIGDVIVEVDETNVQGMPAQHAARLLSGPAGSFVTVTALRQTNGMTYTHTAELMRDVSSLAANKTSAEQIQMFASAKKETMPPSLLLPQSPAQQAQETSRRVPENAPSLLPPLLPTEIFKENPEVYANSPSGPVNKVYRFKIWVISAQHQPTKFMGQNPKRVNIFTCDTHGDLGRSFETSCRNNKEHPVWEEGFDVELDETFSFVRFVVDEVGDCSLSLEQLQDLSKASLPRSSERESILQAQDSPKSSKKSLSLKKSLSRTLAFNKSSSEIAKQQEIFEYYPGAFALQLMQSNGEPIKTKKGGIPCLYLHVFMTYETPDPEPLVGAQTKVYQVTQHDAPPRSISNASENNEILQHRMEQEQMIILMDQGQMLQDLEKEIDSKIAASSNRDPADSAAANTAPRASSSPAAPALESVDEGDSAHASPAPISEAPGVTEAGSEQSLPSRSTLPASAKEAESPLRSLNSPRRRVSAGVEDIARIFGEKNPPRASDVSESESFFVRSPAIGTDSWMNVDTSRTNQPDASKAYPIEFEILESRCLPRFEGSESSIMCLVQAGDQNFQTAASTSGVFPQESNSFKAVLQHDDEVLVTIIDSNRPTINKVIGYVRIPVEKLVFSRARQDIGDLISKRKSTSDLMKSTSCTDQFQEVNEVFVFPVVRSDGSQVFDPNQHRNSVLVVRCKRCSAADIDEVVKATCKSYRPVSQAQQLISSKISVFDGNEDMSGQRLYLKILYARHLTFRSTTFQFCNPYCKIRVGEQQKFQTSKCMGTTEPEWIGETFELEVVSRKDHIDIQVLDWDILQMDRVIGSVKVSINQVIRDTVDGNKRSGVVSKTASSSSVAWAGKNASSSSAFAYNRTSNSSATFNKSASSSSVGMSDVSDDNSQKAASYKIFTSDGMEVRSSQGSAAYVALRVSTEPFNDAAADEPSDKAVKQAWDMHGFVKTDKPKAQRSAAPPQKSLADGEAEHTLVSINAESPIIQPIEAGLHSGQTLSGGTIAVAVIGCADLPVWDQPGTSCNPYCILQLGDQKKTTQLKHNMRDPYFGEVFTFPFSQGANEEMTVTVKHREQAGDQMLGWVSIPIAAIEDYVRQSKMERALSGLSFLRPSSPKSPDPNELEGISSNRFQPLDISRCSEVSEHDLHKKYPGLKRFPLEGAAEKMGADGQFIERPGLFLRFEIENENTENLQTHAAPSIPVFGQKEGQIAVTSTPESPIYLLFSFAEDIVPFALDSTLVSEWTFSLHRDLSRVTGEHHSRFDIVSADIKDIVTVKLVVRPPYMLENVRSTRTAKEVVAELQEMVRNTKSKLRRMMPSLFEMTEEGDEEESNSDNQTDSSTMGSDDDDGTRDEDDMGTSIESVEQDQAIEDEDEMIDMQAYVREISDEKIEGKNLQEFTTSASRTVLAAAPPPSPPVLAAVSPPQDAPQTSSKMPMNPQKVSAHIQQLKKSIIPADMPHLEGAELYSLARKSLGSRDKKADNKADTNAGNKEADSKSKWIDAKHDTMIKTYMNHMTKSNYQAKLLRKILTEWHQFYQEGAESDATDDHDAELPLPTFHNSSLNHDAFQTELKKSDTPLASTLFLPRTPSHSPSLFQLEKHVSPLFFPHKPGNTVKDESNDDDDIPPAWTKLLNHMKDARQRKVKELVASKWMASMNKFGADIQRASSHSDDHEDDSIRDRPMMHCVVCGMYKRREKMEKTGMCLKCSRREDSGDFMARQLAKDSRTSQPSDHHDLSDHHDERDWDHPNLC